MSKLRLIKYHLLCEFTIGEYCYTIFFLKRKNYQTYIISMFHFFYEIRILGYSIVIIRSKKPKREIEPTNCLCTVMYK